MNTFQTITSTIQTYKNFVKSKKCSNDYGKAYCLGMLNALTTQLSKEEYQELLNLINDIFDFSDKSLSVVKYVVEHKTILDELDKLKNSKCSKTIDTTFSYGEIAYMIKTLPGMYADVPINVVDNEIEEDD